VRALSGLVVVEHCGEAGFLRPGAEVLYRIDSHADALVSEYVFSCQ
jgi:hypothetical protein